MEERMELLAHATSLEAAAGIVVFLAGTCAGVLIAQFVYSWMKQRRS
jgi:hypothetical protein